MPSQRYPSVMSGRISQMGRIGRSGLTRERRLVGRGACREGLPTLPGRGFIFVLDRWLTPPANLRQASGLG